MNYIIDFRLNLFGEGGDGASASEGTETGEQNLVPPTRVNRKADTYSNVKFGKQEETSSEEEPEKQAEQTPEDLRKEYDALIKGKYKSLYTEDTQNMINKRFAKSKEAEEKSAKAQPILDALMTKYKVSDLDMLSKAIDDDSSYWEQAADEAGMTVEQFKQFQKLETQNKQLLDQQNALKAQAQADEQLKKWMSEADAVKAKFPQFDLDAEVQNPQFQQLLRAGLPIEHAYKVIHMDDIVTDAMKTTASLAEKRVVDNIRAKGSRPSEAGANTSGAFTIKDDVHSLSKADRAEIARRAQRGERISF